MATTNWRDTVEAHFQELDLDVRVSKTTHDETDFAHIESREGADGQWISFAELDANELDRYIAALQRIRSRMNRPKQK